MSLSLLETETLIYCDGACSGNPGPGGWGSLILDLKNQRVLELGGKLAQTTNNQMEMKAAIEALKVIKDRNQKVLVFTDSNYLVQGISQWIWKWQKNGWKTQEGNPVANQDLWQKLFDEKQRLKHLRWQKIPGHAGIRGNERVDEIAVQFSRDLAPPLFNGPSHEYSIPLEFLIPPFENQTIRFPIYLSYVNGVLGRHQTWIECEKVVKGKAQARFKKISSSFEEKEILRSWAVDT